MRYFILALQKYAQFSGRATRTEYWYFTLFSTLIQVVLTIIGVALTEIQSLAMIMSIISMLVSVALLIPSISVTVRRLHDIGKSGYMFFITLIPIIGMIWLLILLCTASDIGENKYGTPSL